MSRIGKKPIAVPDEVKITIKEETLEVKGPKGTLVTPILPGIKFNLDKGVLTAQVENEDRKLRALHGLCRSLAANAVEGVSKGFSKELVIEGIGYKAEVKGKEVVFSLGYSHPIHFPIPEGIAVNVEKMVNIKVSGFDRQLVGQVAADIRKLRKPDCYKGKGIRYRGEIVRKKVGKAAVGTGG
jgi:large subunit ribosomal protein L6